MTFSLPSFSQFLVLLKSIKRVSRNLILQNYNNFKKVFNSKLRTAGMQGLDRMKVTKEDRMRDKD